MAFYNLCEICGESAEYIGVDPYFPHRNCPRCGNYDYDSSVGWLGVKSVEHKVRLSAWVREQNAAGLAPVRITPEISRRVSQLPLPRLRERANRALSVIVRKFPELQKPTPFDTIAADRELLALTYSATATEARPLLDILLDDGYIRGFKNITTNTTTDGAVTAKGLLAADDFLSPLTNSLQCFVAMSFDPVLDHAWVDGFDPGIRMAGFQPFRIDNKEYVGGISDEIIAEIRRSRFVVADYSGQVNGVYFEAGFALGLGLTVIPTCQKNEVGALHFDIRHINTLLWESPVELASALDKRIRAVIGMGPSTLTS